MEVGGRAQVSEGKGDSLNIDHANDGFYYNVREVRGQRVRLKCRHYSKGCRGTAVLFLDNHALAHRHVHSHDPDPHLIEELKLRREIILQACTNANGRTAKQIVNDCKLRNLEAASRITPARMRGRIHEAKGEHYPPIPLTLLYLGVLLGLPNMRPICTTRDGSDFIFKGVVGNEAGKTVSVVFISGRMLQFMCTRFRIHCDGTFKKRTKVPFCRQIFNIVTKYGNAVVAMMRVLMVSKKEAAYVALINYIHALAPNFSPGVIHCDFERAHINAWRSIFPQAIIAGCLWHYAVAVSRYARSLGLAALAVENVLLLSFIRRLCAVPLLPRNLIGQGAHALWLEIEAAGLQNHLRPLFDYFDREWFPRVDELCVYGMPDRTNNCSEADNHSIATVIPQNRPNIWFLLSAFVSLEFLAWSDKIAIENGRNVAGPRKWSAVHNDRVVKRNTELLANHDITPSRFLRNVSWCIGGAVNHGLMLDDDSSGSESD